MTALDKAAFVAAVLAALLVVSGLAWYWHRSRRIAAQKAARLRRRLFEVGMEIERERDAALAEIARDVRAENATGGSR